MRFLSLLPVLIVSCAIAGAELPDDVPAGAVECQPWIMTEIGACDQETMMLAIDLAAGELMPMVERCGTNPAMDYYECQVQLASYGQMYAERSDLELLGVPSIAWIQCTSGDYTWRLTRHGCS